MDNNSPVLNPFSVDAMLDDIAAMLKQRLAELDRARLQLLDVLSELTADVEKPKPTQTATLIEEKPKRRVSARTRALISKRMKAVWGNRKKR